jgi:hypothetical protein
MYNVQTSACIILGKLCMQRVPVFMSAHEITLTKKKKKRERESHSYYYNI